MELNKFHPILPKDKQIFLIIMAYWICLDSTGSQISDWECLLHSGSRGHQRETYRAKFGLWCNEDYLLLEIMDMMDMAHWSLDLLLEERSKLLNSIKVITINGAPKLTSKLTKVGNFNLNTFYQWGLWLLWKLGTTTCPLICVLSFNQHLPCLLSLAQLLFFKKLTSCKHSVLPLVTAIYWIYSSGNLVQFSELDIIPGGQGFDIIIFPLSTVLCLFYVSQNFSQVSMFLKELPFFLNLLSTILTSMLNMLTVIALILKWGVFTMVSNCFTILFSLQVQS